MTHNLTPEQFDQLVQNGVLSGDGAVFDLVRNDPHHVPADRTRAAVRRALEALEANGLITFVPAEDWPEWFAMEPPYTGFALPEEQG